MSRPEREAYQVNLQVDSSTLTTIQQEQSNEETSVNGFGGIIVQRFIRHQFRKNWNHLNDENWNHLHNQNGDDFDYCQRIYSHWHYLNNPYWHYFDYASRCQY